MIFIHMQDMKANMLKKCATRRHLSWPVDCILYFITAFL